MNTHSLCAGENASEDRLLERKKSNAQLPSINAFIRSRCWPESGASRLCTFLGRISKTTLILRINWALGALAIRYSACRASGIDNVIFHLKKQIIWGSGSDVPICPVPRGPFLREKKDRRFGVVFCIPYDGYENDVRLEYCMQEVDIDDILSYTDLYRHSICEKDDVLVPAIFLQSHSAGESLQVDPPFAGHPYVLAVVHKGFEPRSSRITESPGRKTSTLVVKLAGSRKPLFHDIPTGCALWISEKQARQLYSQGCHFFDQENVGMKDSSPYQDEFESPCMHGAPTSPSHNVDIGDIESQYSTKSSEDFRRSTSASLSMRRRDCENSDASSALEKSSQSSSRRSGISGCRSKRPQWQYWGKGGIPNLLDPPSHEPYMPQKVFGPASIINSRPGNEWPAAHFAIVNRSLENITAQNNSTRVYEAMRQVDQPLPKSIGLP
nr:hypothetical transcript [Hymenolepis microstoma]